VKDNRFIISLPVTASAPSFPAQFTTQSAYFAGMAKIQPKGDTKFANAMNGV